MIFDNSEKIDKALNDIAEKDPLVQNDILTQDDRQLKAVERCERAPQQRPPLQDVQNNDENLPLEINNDLDDFLNDDENDDV
ncbi:unnamed protein product [Bathycoccus prasinos]